MNVEAPSTFTAVPSIYRLTPYQFPETTETHYHYCNTCGQLCCCQCGTVMDGVMTFPAITPEGFVTETGFLLSAAP